MNFTEPAMPASQTLFQKMIDNFGTAGTIGLAIAGAGVALAVIVALGFWGWRVAKKWLSASK